jgi:hypothetical protein
MAQGSCQAWMPKWASAASLVTQSRTWRSAANQSMARAGSFSRSGVTPGWGASRVTGSQDGSSAGRQRGPNAGNDRGPGGWQRVGPRGCPELAENLACLGRWYPGEAGGRRYRDVGARMHRAAWNIRAAAFAQLLVDHVERSCHWPPVPDGRKGCSISMARSTTTRTPSPWGIT